MIKGPLVLLVEDDLTTASALSTILRRRGFEVMHTTTVAGGIELLTREPAFVLLDLMLPDGNGATVLAEIRSRGMSSRVLVTTAVSDLDRLTEVKALRPDSVLQKPIDLQILLALLRPIN